MPLTFFRNTHTCKLYNNVHRRTVFHITCKKGSHTVTVFHPAVYELVYFNGAVNVQTIAEHNLLRCRVNAKTFIFRDYLFRLFFLTSTVYAQPRKHHSHALRKITEEHLVAKTIV